MDISLLTKKLIMPEDITHADYLSEGDKLEFSREINKTAQGERYNSYSSMVDNLIYQPLWVKNSYELGKTLSETENISLGGNSFIFDRVPKGIRKILYKNSGNPLIEVKFEIQDNGIREFDFDQVLVLAFTVEDENIEKSYNLYIHDGQYGSEGIGHRFHRAYNAIQYQDSDSIASKLLLSAIFDTFDLDFSKGTLIGGDTSKFFVGNRIKNESTPIIYGKYADVVIDTDTPEYCSLKGLTIPEIEANLLGCKKTISSDMNVVEFIGTANDGYYRSRIYEDEDGCLIVSKFSSLDYSEVPSINPMYNNEETYTYGYITNCSVSGNLYYPPSQGVLFEYGKNGEDKKGENIYYYIKSPFIDSGFENAPNTEEFIGCALYDYGYKIRDEMVNDERIPVVGTKLDSGCSISPITVSHLYTGTGGLLSDDSSEWNYNSFGELILNKNQISKTYPIL